MIVSPRLALLAFLCLGPGLGLPAAEAPEAPPRRGLSASDRPLEPEIEPASEEAQLAVSRMVLPPGFQATLWAAEPMLANPVAFNFDERGRVFVAETHRYGSSVLDIRGYMWTLEDELANRTQDDFLAAIRKNFGEDGIRELSKESEIVRLLEDTDGDGVADKSSVYADNFRSPLDGGAAGVLARRGKVWLTNIPALWQFTGRDKAETRQELLRGFGVRFNFTGHDLHGLILGPDGRIYFSIGDRGAHVPTREGTTVAAPDVGAVFRCWPDGTGFELFATGLRNPQSLVFNEYGDLFTGDNDSDQGDEERLVHVVEHGDSGWRVGYQFAPMGQAGPWNSEKLWHPRHAGQPAYFLAPLINLEDGPSGLTYYPGTGLTPAYAGNLFVTHFKGAISNSGIYTYKLKQSGATYAVESAAPFLTSALPTDVRFGPDGKLYYSDWVEGFPKSRRGRIYAIFDPAHANAPELKAVQALIASDFTQKTDDDLARLLAHADWRIRLEAQYTLAERGAAGIAAFQQTLAGDHSLARRHAVWGLGQLARRHADALPVLRAQLTAADAEVRAQALKTLGDLRDHASADAAIAALSAPQARVRFFAAEALAKMNAPAATSALLAAARSNNDADDYLRHALVMALARCATADQLVATTRDASAAVRLAAVLALRHQGEARITAFLADTDPLIVREAVIAINDAPIAAAYPAIAALLAQPLADEPILLRAANAHFRLGQPANAAALAEFAGRTGAPAKVREEALELLALWPKPPARDRVVGIYRPLVDRTRPEAVALAALQPQLASLLGAGAPENVQLAALDTVVTLKMKDALPLVRALVADSAHASRVRVQALRSLEKLGDEQLAASAELAAGSNAPELRLAALPVTTRLAPDTAVARLRALIATGTPRELQAAYRALGAATDPAADATLLEQLALFADGRIPAAAQLDLLDAAARREDPRIEQVLAEREAKLAQDPDPLAPFRVALAGGDPAAGMRLFRQHPVLQCIRCHRVGEGSGGDAGPNLAGLGARVAPEYILEAIIKPSATLAPGFETATVTRQDGTTVSGTVLERGAQALRLKAGDGSQVTIPTSAIQHVESLPSGMPEVAALVLTKAEIRDLVATVSALKTPVRGMDAASMRATRRTAGDDRKSAPSDH